MKKKKIFKSRMSFDKSELLGLVSMYGGVNMPIPTSQEDMYKEMGLERKPISFGMYGNMPQFYPNMQNSDIVPKEEDFIRVPFRLLSATIVGGGTWKATDFSNTAVLKKSVKMLEGKPMFKDHETDIDNWIGYVEGSKWTEAKKDSKTNLTVPAGIDGIVVVDSKIDPKVARGLLLGTIFSNSVTVEFNWEMSHEFENEYDFNRNIGTLGKDGKMIRRVVTQINNYHESSLVWLGADPFAKMIEQDGTLRHIDTTGIVEYDKVDSGIKDMYEKEKKFKVGCEFSKELVSLTQRIDFKQKDKQENLEKMDKIKLAIIAAFGLAKDVQLTEDDIVSYICKMTSTEADSYKGLSKKAGAFDKLSKVTLQSDADKFETVEMSADEVQEVSDKAVAKFGGKDVVLVTSEHLSGLNTRIANLDKLAKIGETTIKNKKEEVVRLYKIAVGDKVDNNVVTMFENAEPEALDGLLAQYTKGATAKFTATCKSCNGTDFEFRSTISGEAGKTTTDNDIDKYVVTGDDFKNKYGKKTVH